MLKDITVQWVVGITIGGLIGTVIHQRRMNKALQSSVSTWKVASEAYQRSLIHCVEIMEPEQFQKVKENLDNELTFANIILDIRNDF